MTVDNLISATLKAKNSTLFGWTDNYTFIKILAVHTSSHTPIRFLAIFSAIMVQLKPDNLCNDHYVLHISETYLVPRLVLKIRIIVYLSWFHTWISNMSQPKAYCIWQYAVNLDLTRLKFEFTRLSSMLLKIIVLKSLKNNFMQQIWIKRIQNPNTCQMFYCECESLVEKNRWTDEQNWNKWRTSKN